MASGMPSKQPLGTRTPEPAAGNEWEAVSMEQGGKSGARHHKGEAGPRVAATGCALHHIPCWLGDVCGHGLLDGCACG